MFALFALFLLALCVIIVVLNVLNVHECAGFARATCASSQFVNARTAFIHSDRGFDNPGTLRTS